MTHAEIIQVLSGFVGSIGFAILFNIRGKRLFTAALGGFFSWLIYVILNNYIASEPVIYFIVACIVSIYAEIMARVIKTPTTPFIITALIPLIPGGSLYYTMVHAFQANLDTFFPKAISTMQLASALALGVIVATTFTRIYNKVILEINKKKG